MPDLQRRLREIQAELEKAIAKGNGTEIQRLRNEANQLKERRIRLQRGRDKAVDQAKGTPEQKNVKPKERRKLSRYVPEGSLMGEPPLPPRTGFSADHVMRSGNSNLLSAGMPGNDETDPTPRRR